MSLVATRRGCDPALKLALVDALFAPVTVAAAISSSRCSEQMGTPGCVIRRLGLYRPPVF